MHKNLRLHLWLPSSTPYDVRHLYLCPRATRFGKRGFMEIAGKFNALTRIGSDEKQVLLKYGPPLVTAIVVLWIAARLVSLTWLLLDRPAYDANPDTTVAAAPDPGTTVDSAAAISTIQQAHLFGKYVPPPATDSTAPAVEEPTDLPVISLADLTLKGTVASTSKDNGLAIVEHRGEEKVFTIDDTIASGLVLKRVLSQEIHVSQRGKMSKIPLAKTGDNGATGRRSTTTSTSRRANRAPARASVSSNNVRSNLATKLGDLLRPQPVFQDGKQLGYRVYPGRKRDQFKALGLKPGDLVTEINGTPLNDPTRGLEIFRSLNESTQVSVSIQRNGAQTSLVLDTSQLNAAGSQ
ncbi:MAG: hypothetical protein HKN70_02465 [Gammaproteobacteria bacterium]|nr:hypothetical protein [Gammaproteobacteria bacterium]